MTTSTVIAFVGLLVFLAHLFAALFSRTRVPDVLFLIIIGLALGPISGLVSPADFGAVGPVMTAITLVVILFEAGLDLDVRELGRALRGTLSVSVAGFVASTLVVAALCYVALGLGLLRSLMLGAMLGGTSSAVVIPMLQQLTVGGMARTILSMESAITDVLCIVVALALLESLKLGSMDVGRMFGTMIAAFVLATLVGLVAGVAWSAVLHRIRGLKTSTFTTAAFVFVIYGIVEALGYSGAIAALAFGVALGNTELFHSVRLRAIMPKKPVTLTDTERAFFAEVVFLLKTFFFVFIGLSLVLTDVALLTVGLAVTALLFAVRVPVVWSTAPREISRTDAALCAVMIPKGLAPAVLASLPLQQGISGGATIQLVAYAVVFFSIVFTSVLVFLLERSRLKEMYVTAFSRFAPAEAARSA